MLYELNRMDCTKDTERERKKEMKMNDLSFEMNSPVKEKK